MLLVPSSLQNSRLPVAGKKCIQSIQYRLPDEYIGIDGLDITGIPEDDYFAILGPNGLVLISFPRIEYLSVMAFPFLTNLWEKASTAFISRLQTHHSLKKASGDLLFPVAVIAVFPELLSSEIDQSIAETSFCKQYCRFKEWTDSLKPKGNAEKCLIDLLFTHTQIGAVDSHTINDDIRDIIINRIAPWATIPKLTQAEIKQAQQRANAPSEHFKTIMGLNDSMVDVLRLDPKQVDEINSIRHGHQLILACAGSGKSVLLIAKCFKLASMDKNRQYIILCYNQNLRDYYRWQIDEAGFNTRNVTCSTFFQLCNKLLEDNHLPKPYVSKNEDYYSAVADRVYQYLVAGQIKQRFYGIFIDEVQIFDPLWYRICCKLLENPDTDDHMLAICGDMTQNLKKYVKHGTAPWQGEGLPVFKGKTIHIEKNYRNSVQKNDFVNIYSGKVRQWLPEGVSLQTDTYLRGTAFREGSDPRVYRFNDISMKAVEAEAEKIAQAVQHMHDIDRIGYSDIAVLLYNGSCKGDSLPKGYPIKAKTRAAFFRENIPFLELAWKSQGEAPVSYEMRNGVSLITYEGALGIDFRGVVVAGIPTIGARLGVQYDNAESIKDRRDDLQFEYHMGFDAIYLACTRAKDSLAIVIPESDCSLASCYSQILEDCISAYAEKHGGLIND